MEDPDPNSLQLQEAMEDPITASLGPTGPLLRKLHSIGPEQCPPDEIRTLKVLCISLKELPEDDGAGSTNRWWRKVARELCYDTEDHLDEVCAAAGAHLNLSELLARVKDASERRERFQWSPLQTIIKPADLTSPDPELPAPICGRSTADPVVESPKKLVELLAFDDDNMTHLKVIPITGCAGIGKTTLAKTLYHNHGGKFQCRAFGIVSRNLDMRAFLTNMLSQLKAPLPRGFPDVLDFIDAINKHLQGKRFFVVIDDLWTASVWDIISSAFPRGDHCSRIITTTQIDDVALACCSYDPEYIYKMEPLNDQESRKLFFSRVFGSEDGYPTDIKEISYEIVRKCGGLPSVIVNVASLFASESNIVREKWKHIHDSLSSTSEGMKEVVNCMYKSLPSRLRTCLLYLSMYQQGYVIKKDDLLKQWVAEGFLSAVGRQDTEEIAEGYFDELVSRGMVQAVDTDNNGEVLSCTVHQTVLEFIRHKSMEENFIITVDYFQSTLALPDKVRRLSVQFGGVKGAYIPQSLVTSHVRSLIYWGFFKCVPCITEYRLLRVLILHIWADRDKKSFDLTTIGKLFQLKYLKIECNITVKLPGKIRRLQHLGTLQVDARLYAVPSDIVRLERLLHLRFPSEYILPPIVAHMTSLRTLGYFDLSSHSEGNVLHLGRLTNLHDLQLTCSTTVQPAENLKKNVQLLGSILEKLCVLQSVTLVPASGSCNLNIPQDDAGTAIISIPCDGFGMVSPPLDLLLRKIKLSRRCCIFVSLPKWFGELKKLCILKIGIKRLSMNDTDILKGLPALTALTLYIQIAPAARIFISKGGFQVLTDFKFTCAAPCLSFAQGAMPKLQKLTLGFNSNEERPHSLGTSGFLHLTALTELSVNFGVRDVEEFDRKAADSALKAAVKYHPNTPLLRVQIVDVISYVEEYQSSTETKGKMKIMGLSEEQEEDRQEISIDKKKITEISEGNQEEIQEDKKEITARSEENVKKQDEDKPVAMPATDAFALPAAHHTSLDQIHHHHSIPRTPAAEGEVDAFQRHVADRLLDLLPSSGATAAPPEILSIAWTGHLLDSFLICLEEFRSVLLGFPLASPPPDSFVADFIDSAVKALDLCNALDDGVNLLRRCRKHLAIAAAALASSPGSPLGKGQIRRARKALSKLTILMIDNGGSHFRSLSCSVSQSWSASRQLQAIRGSLPVPRANDVAATGGLATAVYTMRAVLFVTAWALVAAIPCQDRGLYGYFAVPTSFPWAGPATTLYERILEEFKKKERRHSCGLLKEIHQIDQWYRQLMEITDAAQFPLDEEKHGEIQVAAQELVQVCETLKDGLDPLERQVREMFHQIVGTRIEILDCLSTSNSWYPGRGRREGRGSFSVLSKDGNV